MPGRVHRAERVNSRIIAFGQKYYKWFLGAFAVFFLLNASPFSASPTFRLWFYPIDFCFYVCAAVFAGARAKALWGDKDNAGPAWASLAAALTMQSMGDLSWILRFAGLTEQIARMASSTFYTLGYPFLIGATVLLLTKIPAVSRSRTLVDGALGTLGLGLVMWSFLLSGIARLTHLSALDRVYAVIYPLGDLVVLYLAGSALMMAQETRLARRQMLFVALGATSTFVADVSFSTYSYFHALPSFWTDSFWAMGSMFYLMAALQANDPEETYLHARQKSMEAMKAAGSSLKTVAPYLFVGVGIGFLVTKDLIVQGSLSPFTLGSSAVMMLVVLVRQVIMLNENAGLQGRLFAELDENQGLNQRLKDELEENQLLNDRLQDELVENETLMEELRSVTERLEEKVALRTSQLEELYLLTKEVTSSLDYHEVIDLACRSAWKALKADHCVIWTCTDDDCSESMTLHCGEEDVIGTALKKRLAAIEFSEISDLLPLAQSWSEDIGEPGMLLCSPIVFGDKPLGMLGMIRWGGAFDNAEIQLSENIALELGTAMMHSLRFEQAINAADRDPMTGLLNHRAIHERLTETLAASAASGEPVSVFMMDMNNFKLFNDTYGHPVGDEVLRSAAAALAEAMPPGTHLGRYGGDEFLAIFPNTDAEEAERAAALMLDAASKDAYSVPGSEHAIPVSLCGGIATSPTDSQSHHELLTIADQNLYKAKGTDRGLGVSSTQQRENRALKTEASFAILEAMVTSIDNKDKYTRRHSEDVTEYALWIAEELGLSQEACRTIRMSGLLHDVGKIGVPDEILHKPGRLSPEEMEIMQRHPRLGALIVGAIPGMEEIVDGVLYHHERWDGHGYPCGLKEDEIPLLGRILAVADAFSAMTTDRPYRKGMEFTQAIKEIRSNRGTQFDPHLASLFVRAVERRIARESGGKAA